jgi:iron complex transport system substrate-binding protein
MTQLRATLFAFVLVVSLAGLAATPASASHDGGENCEFPLTVTDGSGTEVALNGSAETIVAGDAASAQTFWAVGADDRVVGMPVQDYTAYLEGSEQRTDVLTDDGMGLDVETIVELDADLVVVANYTSPDTVQQLRDAGQTVYVSPFEKSFEDIYAKTELYGHFVGDCEAGRTTAEETRQEVESIREAVGDRERPDVLFYFYGTAAGNATFTHDLLGTAGGNNVAAEAGIQHYEAMSDEAILEQDPEWVVTVEDDAAFDAEAQPFPSTTAVQEDQVLRVNTDLVQQAGPRIVEPLRTIAEAFHPEAFHQANGTATPEETRESTPAGDSEDDGAGLGAVAAVVALAGTALLARRK